MEINANRVVVFLHPNIQAVSTPPIELFEKMNDYGESFHVTKLGNSERLILLVGISKSILDETTLQSFRNLSVVRFSKSSALSVRFTLCSIFFLRKLLSDGFQVTVVAGDLRASLLPLILLKRIFGKKVRTQISIHGNVPFQKKLKSLKVFLVLRLIRIALNSADSIRVVSCHLKELITHHIQGAESRIFVSPIAISHFALEGKLFLGERDSIAIVGRLHVERNVMQALEYSERILLADRRVKLFVVGNGPLVQDINLWISNSEVGNQIEMLGALSIESVMNLYSRIDIVISNADNEGYGLVVREALLNGCRVLMRRNEGSADLRKVYGEFIFEYSSSEEFWEKYLTARNLRPTINSVNRLRETQKHLDIEHKKVLVESWLSNR